MCLALLHDPSKLLWRPRSSAVWSPWVKGPMVDSGGGGLAVIFVRAIDEETEE